MRNLKRVLAVTAILVLVLSQVAMAANVSDVNGSWKGKTIVTIGDASIAATMVTFQDGRVRVVVGKSGVILKSAFGTYTITDNKINMTLNSKVLGPLVSSMSYEKKAATKTVAEHLVLQGSALGLTAKQNFYRVGSKITEYGYKKVKRGAETNLKLRTTGAANFVIVYDASGVELGRSTVKSTKNVFAVPVTLSKKTNTVYACSGVFDIDGKVQTTELSAKKKITIYCN